jgi:hypothetical protein
MPEPGVSIFSPPRTPHANPAPAVPVSIPNPPPGAIQSSPTETEAQARWRADREAIAASDP